MSDTPTRTKVRGIKFGTWEKYKALDHTAEGFSDTLFFITNHGGAIYRGDSLVEPQHVIETCTPSQGTVSGSNVNVSYHFDITTFNTASGGTQADPVTLSFDVYTKEAVDAIRTALESAMSQHRTISSGVFADGKGTSSNFGHVKLTDTVDETTKDIDASYGIGTSPKAVYDAIADALGGIGGAMVFKGQVGKAAAYDSTATYVVGAYCEYDSKLWRCNTAITTAEAWNSSHWTEVPREATDLPTPAQGYEAGWTYRVCAPNTYAGQVCEAGDIIIALNTSSGSGTSVVNADWTVGQVNTDGTVTISANLIDNALVVGSGNTTIKPLANGTAGQYLRIVNGVPTWANHPNTDHGIAKCACSTDFTDDTTGTSDCVVTLVSASAGTFKLVNGAVIAVAFTNTVSDKKGDVTLNVDNTGAKLLYFRGAKIGEGVIAAGDTATLMYNGTYWDLLAVDKAFANVAISGNYDDLIHKPIQYATNSQNADVAARTLGISDYTELNGNTKILAVTFTNGIVYDSATAPTLSINGGTAKNIKWHGSNIDGNMIIAGDTVMMVNSGTSYDIIGVNRKIDNAPVSGSSNLVTSGGVHAAIQNAINAAALWWEELT